MVIIIILFFMMPGSRTATDDGSNNELSATPTHPHNLDQPRLYFSTSHITICMTVYCIGMLSIYIGVGVHQWKPVIGT